MVSVVWLLVKVVMVAGIMLATMYYLASPLNYAVLGAEWLALVGWWLVTADKYRDTGRGNDT